VEAIIDNINDENIEIIFRTVDDFVFRYDSNLNNSFKAEQMLRNITIGIKACYFQKQWADDINNFSRHKIIIPLEQEVAVEFIVGLKRDRIDAFSDLYSYRVLKVKEILFLREQLINCHNPVTSL